MPIAVKDADGITRTIASIDDTLLLDDTGAPIYPDRYPHTYSYIGDKLSSESFTSGFATWQKNYSYTGALLTFESAWLRL